MTCEKHQKFSKRKGTSDDDGSARGIVWILLYFDHVWVFVLRAPIIGAHRVAYSFLRVSRDACNPPALLFFDEICIGIDDSFLLKPHSLALQPPLFLLQSITRSVRKLRTSAVPHQFFRNGLLRIEMCVSLITS